MFFPTINALNLNKKLDFSRLIQMSLQQGTWAILEPVKLENHAPQL